MRMARVGMALIAVICLAVLAVACGGEEEEGPTPAAGETATPTEERVVPGITDTEIILGMDAPLSGTWGAAYSPVVSGVKAYFNYLNGVEGGVCGREIVLKVEDNQYLPAEAVEAVRKLLDRDRVFAIIASIGTAAHAATWEELNERGVPDLWIMSGAHMFGSDPEKYPWSVPLLPDFYVEGTIFGRYISENMPGKKVGVLYQNDDMGRDELAGLKNGLDPEKNELVSEQSYELAAVSIRSQVTNLKNDGAEVVFGSGNPPSVAQLIKEADRMGYHPQFFIGFVNSDPMMFQYVTPELMEGVMTLQGNKLSTWTDDPAIAEHYQIMNEYGDCPPGNFTVVGHAAAAMTVEALSRTCDNLTREGLMDAVHSFEDYQGELTLPGITVTLSPTDHLAVEAMRMLRATLVDGQGEWEYFGDIISFRQEAAEGE